MRKLNAWMLLAVVSGSLAVIGCSSAPAPSTDKMSGGEMDKMADDKMHDGKMDNMSDDKMATDKMDKMSDGKMDKMEEKQ